MNDLLEVPDVPRSNGSHQALEVLSQKTSDFVRAADTTGLNLSAMTNTLEFGSSVHTDNSRFSATQNPWSNTSPAGSCGGAVLLRWLPATYR